MPLSTHHSFLKLAAHFRLYDSLFVILYNIWKEDPGEWTNNFENIHKDMHALAYKRFMKKMFVWKILEMILENIYIILILINFL